LIATSDAQATQHSERPANAAMSSAHNRRSVQRSGPFDNGRVVTRISSPTFIGRRPELERVALILADAARATSAVVLVAGEAGVGKTRFAEEAIRSARGAGVLALSGGCVELGGAGLPFAPITEVLRGLTSGFSTSRMDQLLGPARTELGRLFPDLAREADAGNPHGFTYVSAQARLFEEFLALLRRMARERRILLVIEDLHWADRSTLGLLAYLGRNARDEGITVLATYRNDELHRRHPLVPVLAELERARHTERIELLRFDRLEVTEQVAGIRDEPADQALIERIYARSDGNAFYVEELLATGSAWSPLPEQLRDVLLARVSELSEPTREILRIAAAGPRIQTSILASVAAIGA
jgi:predicted ATPase